MACKYIEKEFPSTEINYLSVPERIALKPIYMMHRIFARRIGSVFRAIILGALKDENTPLMEEFYRSQYRKEHSKLVILDPMCGGGTTLIEGSRIGAKTIGFEINPVPWFVTKCELTIVSPNELKKEFELLEKNVGTKIKKMYKTTCPRCSSTAEIIYTFWIKTINCPNCYNEIELFKDYIITFDKKEQNYFVLCPSCHKIIHYIQKPGENERCPHCGFVFKPFQGNVLNNSVICPYCSAEFNFINELRKINTPPKIKQYAIDGWCWKCKFRFIKQPDHFDLEKYEAIKREFVQKRDRLLFPREEIPDGFNTNQMKKHNYQFWYQMFNERQLFSLSLLLTEIMKIEKENVREALLCAFSETLRSNNLFCYYDRRWAKQLTPLFSRKDFAPVYFPLEQNVWGGRFGRGSFKQTFNRLLEGKKYNLKPFERKYTGKKTQRIFIDEKIGESHWELYCEDARKMDKYIKGKVDLIITDPPYFDSINYSEVYDFFYVWLRLALKDRYPWFKPTTTLNDAEAIVNEIQGKTRENYLAILSEIFCKSARLLKDDGLFIFTFHDFDEDSWWDMFRIVKRAGLDVIKIHFYHGENVSAGRFGGQKTVFDAIWVCGKNVNNKVSISLKDIFSKVKQEVAELLTRVYQGKFFKLNVDDLKIFVLGKLIEIGGEILTKEKLKEIMYILLEDEELLSFQKRQYLKNQFVQLNLFDKDG
jgi:putative DNA methylase